MKNFKKSALMLCSILGLCIFMAISVQSVQAATENSDASTKTGWMTENNHKVYYVNGKKFTKGWKKIGDYVYYFEEKTGYLAVNKIAGSEEKGYYYVGEDGVRCKDATIKKAVSVAMAHSDSTSSRYQRFKQCFRYICWGNYQHMSTAIPKTSELSGMANYMYEHKRGNCYRFASALTYLAKVFGYDTRMVPGYISWKSNVHGWCEVKSKTTGKYLVCDGSFEAHRQEPGNKYKNLSFFMISRSSHPRPLSVNKIYQLTVKKGKVVWTVVK